MSVPGKMSSACVKTMANRSDRLMGTTLFRANSAVTEAHLGTSFLCRFVAIAIFVVLAGCRQGQAPGGVASLTLVQDGQSAYAIYTDAAAPTSVQAAANDLQAYIAKVSGAKLPLVNQPCEPMIALGDTTAAAQAGLNSDKIPLEGFRIITRGQNLFILGPDTADKVLTPQGGTSAGTANGVYAFIEQFLGVRWLMPGDNGDYVPACKTITVPNTDFSDAPFFLNRRLPYIQGRKRKVKRWCARQRLGWSLYLHHGHNWQWSTQEDFRAHPDWFAEQGGTRMPPVNGNSKFCSTSDGLIREFAARAIKYFDDNPQATCYSLSPSDGGGWCNCINCKALYEKDPNGGLSVTPAIIAFYNKVALLVAQKYPQKILAGYVYAAYVYPPSKPFQLAPNMFLVWAPNFDYGFKLYRPDIQKRWDDLMPQWGKVTTNISYYDLPNCVPNNIGAINPPGVKILKWLYPRLKQAQMKGVYVYGNAAWGYAGPMNYLLARLAWNPEADVDALFDEYIGLCYAEGAPEMKQFYMLLDNATEEYYNANHKENYLLSEDRLRKVYGANFAELEKLYRAAEARITNPDAKARLRMLGANLTILHWNLRQFNAVDNPQTSSFYLPNKAFYAFLKLWNNSLAIYTSKSGAKARAGLEKLTSVRALQAPNADAMTPFLLRGDQRLILKPTGGDAAIVSFSEVTSRSNLVKWHLYDAAGVSVDQGIVSPEMPVTLSPAGSDYYQLAIIEAGNASFAMEVKNAAWALTALGKGLNLHFLQKTTPVYFEVPDNVTSFDLRLFSSTPVETAVAKLYAPDGKLVASFRTVDKSVDTQLIKVAPGQAGVWKAVLEKADVGCMDDVHIKLGQQLSGYFSLNPQAVLSVTKAK